MFSDPRLPVTAMQFLTAAFLAILFLQSGLDKVTDRKGNLEWLTGHFAKSPLHGVVPAMLSAITVLEIVAGGLSAAGALQILGGSTGLALLGSIAAAASLTCLFFGQRLAKDYPGAAGLVPYFLVTVAALFLFQLSPR